MSEDTRDDGVEKNPYIRDIRVQCAEEDANQPRLDNLKLIIVKDGESFSVSLTRISKTMWRRGDIDPGAFPARKTLKFLVTSDVHGDLGYTEKNLSQCWDRDGGVDRRMYMRSSGVPSFILDFKWDLECALEDAPALSISFQVCEPGPFEIAFRNMEADSEGNDSLALLLSEALLTPDNEFGKPDLFYDIGDEFHERFAKSQGRPDIDACIQAYDQALNLLSADDDRLIQISNDAGGAYSERYRRFGAIDDINQAIIKWELALPVMSEYDPMAPSLLNDLGCSFLSRFQQAGNFDDLEESIRLHEKAVELTPEGEPELLVSLNNLANSFSSRFQQTGDHSDLLQSVELQQRVVVLTPEDHPNFASRLNNLGASFSSLFEQTGDLNDLSQSIQLQQQAVGLASDESPDLPAWLNNLGNSFSRRFERTGSLDDLEQSIQLNQQALDRTPDGHPYMPTQLNNLGQAFLSSFNQTGDLSHLERSIQLMQQAVELTPDGDPDLPNWLSNLGNSLSARFEQTHSLNDIEQSIQVTQQAVGLTPEGHPNLPGRLNNLGSSFASRFEQTRNLDDVIESIQLQQQAVELTPAGHPELPEWVFNIGISFRSHFNETHQRTSLEGAVFNLRFSATSTTGSPLTCLKAAMLWAVLSHDISSSEVINAHERVIDLISVVAGMENTAKRRYEVLRDSTLSANAAAAALSVHQPAKALEWLEQGRCIVWNQINQLRTPLDELRAIHPHLADRLAQSSKEVERLQARDDRRQLVTDLPFPERVSLETEARSHLRLANERETLLATIRETPGFENFLRPRKCAELMSVIPDDGVVVIVNADARRCDALILIAGREEPTHVPLERFTHERAQMLAEQLREYLVVQHLQARYADEDVPDPRKLGAFRSRRGFLNQLKSMLRTLWTDLLEPILQALGIMDEGVGTDLKRIWWCPTGPFAFLPIHAAGIYDPEPGASKVCLADYVISSYIPNLSILDRLRSRRGETSKPGKGVLLVSQPNTPGLTPIPKTTEETAAICKELERRDIRSTLYSDSEATVARILGSMDSFPCIHLACHASQNLENPLESAIYLHDGKLEMSEIMKKDLPNASLAFLSACQTSAGDRSLPEEVVHLAAGMLNAGYRSVVATMWSISDRYAPEVAEAFYRGLSDDATTDGASGLDITGSAEALHTATQALRTSLDDTKESDLLAWIPYVHFGM